MKKTITLLAIAAILTSASFAQDNHQRDNNYEEGDGNHGNGHGREIAVNNNRERYGHDNERGSYYFTAMEKNMQVSAIGQGLLQGWNSCCVRPEPLLIKDIKVQVNKQKPNNVRPARMKHNSDKMPIAPTSSPTIGNTLVQATPAVGSSKRRDTLPNYKSSFLLFTKLNKNAKE